jgi:GT2 family glycosyltransferase
MSDCTVIIPTYNRPEHLQACLESLSVQSDPETVFSVVVVDDGSDPPVEIEPTDFPFETCVIRLAHNVGPATARNAGMENVDSALVVFLDDDARALDGFLRAYVKRIDPLGCEVGIGDVYLHPDIPSDRLTQYSETRSVRRLSPDQAVPYRYFATGNCAVPTWLLRKVGGFDGRLRVWGGEDTELGLRLERVGAKFVRVPDARALHVHRRTVEELWEAYRVFARESMPLLFDKHPEWVTVFHADVLGPKWISPRGGWLRRFLLRTATKPMIAAIMQRMMSWLPRAPWPVFAFNLLFASAWRRGLDEGYKRRTFTN